MVTQKHYTEISATKGILITLMVIGHSGAPQHLVECIYLFHIPCFFFISGFLFKEKYLNDIGTFITRKIKGLYIPFVKWSITFLLLHNVFYHIGIYDNAYSITDFKHKLFSIFTMTGSEQLLGGFWFLKELLYASIISILIFKVITIFNKRLTIGVLITTSLLLTVCAYLLSTAAFKIPTIGSKTLLATSYFTAGVAFHKANMLLNNNKLLYGIVFFLIFITSSNYIKGTMDIAGINIFPYFIVSIVASIATIYLTKFINKHTTSILDYIGKNTLYILIFHFLSFKIVSFLILTYCDRPITELSSFPVIPNSSSFYWILYTIVGVAVPLVIKYVIDKCHFVLHCKRNANK